MRCSSFSVLIIVDYNDQKVSYTTEFSTRFDGAKSIHQMIATIKLSLVAILKKYARLNQNSSSKVRSNLKQPE